MNMTKSLFPLLSGMLLGLASLIVGGPAAAQTATIPEVSANRVIDLAPAPLSEKKPVVSSVAIDPAGKLLAAVGDDHLVRLFDLQTGKLLHRLSFHSDWVKAAAFRPDGRTLATAGADRRIQLWDMATVANRRAPRTLPGQLPAVHTLAYNGDGRMLAAAGFGDRLWVFDTDQGQPARELAAPGHDIRAIAFSPDGTRMAAAGRTGAVRIWDIDAGRLVADVQVSNRRICALTYSPDGKFLAAAGQQRNVRLLSAATGKPVADLPERPGEVLALCFCGPNLLASAGSGNVIHLWDLTTGAEQRRFVGHTGSITTLVMESHTQTLVSGSYDTTVRLWDLKNRDGEKVTQRGGETRAN
jgi:WD40 repeat protein